MMPDPVTKVKYEQLKAAFDDIQSSLRVINQDLFDIGVKLGVMESQLSEGEPENGRTNLTAGEHDQ